MSNVNNISIVEIFEVIWQYRRLVVRNTIVFVIIGIVIALTTPSEWKSKTELIPEAKSGSSFGSLGGIASLAGVDIGSEGGEGIPAELYPSIIRSTPFLIEALNKRYYYSDIEDSLLLSSYFEKYIKVSLAQRSLGLIKRAFNFFGGAESSESSTLFSEVYIESEDGIYRLTRKEQQLVDALKERVIVAVSERTGTVTISVTTQNPELSANLTSYAKKYLTSYLTKYETKKEQLKLNFIEEQLVIKKSEYEKAQLALAEATDNNINLSTNKSQLELENLRAKRDLVFNIFSSLSQQYEEAKLKVEESTPVFQVLEPVTVPTVRESPNRKMIVIGFLFLSIVLSGIYIYFKKFLLLGAKTTV